MLKFFATGIPSKETGQPSRFLPCVGCPGEGSRIYQRNYQDQFEHEYKQAGRSPHESKDYKQTLKEQNTVYSSSNKFFLSKYDKIGKEKQNDMNPNETDGTGQNLHRFNHYVNWKLYKEKQFANESKFNNSEVQQSAIIPKEEFESKLKEQTMTRTMSQPHYVSRENMYVTKPLTRLDKDFKSQPMIRNVLTVSEDTPGWCQNVNQYYTADNFDSSKKAKLKPRNNTDIFGNTLNKYNNNFMFSCVEPMGNQRFEKKRMVIADTDAVQASKKMSKEELRHGKCRLEWKEDQTKQKFDMPLPQSKVGFTSTPLIKQLERSRHPNKHEFSKVGETELYTKIEKDKSTQLKIGHGTPMTMNPLKY